MESGQIESIRAAAGATLSRIRFEKNDKKVLINGAMACLCCIVIAGLLSTAVYFTLCTLTKEILLLWFKMKE
jgi:hypothetical protein